MNDSSFPLPNGIANEALLVQSSIRQTHILRDPDGRPHTVLGEFPLSGLLAEDSMELSADALRGFLRDLSEAFGIDPELVQHLSLTHTVDVVDGQRAYFFKTVLGSVPIFDSEISILVDFEKNHVLGVNSIALSLLDERLDGVDVEPVVLRDDIDGILAASDHEILESIRAIPTDDTIFEQGVHGEAALLPEASRASLAWYRSRGALFWRVPSLAGEILLDAVTGEIVVEEGGRNGNGSAVVGLNVYRYQPITANTSDPWSLASNVGTEVKNLSVDWDSAGGSVRTYKLRRNYSFPYPLPQVMDDGTLTHTETTISAPEGVPVTFNATMSTNDGSWFRQQHLYYWLRKGRDFFDSQVFPFVSPIYTWGINSISMDRSSVQACGWSGSPACYSDELKRLEFVDYTDSPPHVPRVVAHEYAHHVINMYGDQSGQCIYNQDEGWIVDEALAETFSFLVLGHTIGSAYSSSGYDIDRHTNPGIKFMRTTSPPSCGGDPYTPNRFWRQAIVEIAHNYNCQPVDHCVLSGAQRATFGSDLGWSNQGQARSVVARAMAYAAKILPMSTTMPSVALYTYTYIDLFHSSTVASNAYAVLHHHGAVP